MYKNIHMCVYVYVYVHVDVDVYVYVYVYVCVWYPPELSTPLGGEILSSLPLTPCMCVFVYS